MKGSALRVSERTNIDPVLHTAGVFDGTVDEREQRVILAATNVVAGVDVGAALTNENRARRHSLTAKALAAKALAAGVTAVTGGTKSFFVCHVFYLLFRVLCVLLGSSFGLGLSGLGGLLRSARSSLDLRDLQLRELLTMALETTIALTLLELEDELLLTFELV